MTITFPLEKPPTKRVTKDVHFWKLFDEVAFTADLLHSPIVSMQAAVSDMYINEMVRLYGSTLNSLLDKHCPLITAQMKCRTLMPWFDSDCRASRRRERLLEKKHRSSMKSLVNG